MHFRNFFLHCDYFVMKKELVVVELVLVVPAGSAAVEVVSSTAVVVPDVVSAVADSGTGGGTEQPTSITKHCVIHRISSGL